MAQDFTPLMESLAGAWAVEERATQEYTQMLLFLWTGSSRALTVAVCMETNKNNSMNLLAIAKYFEAIFIIYLRIPFLYLVCLALPEI